MTMLALIKAQELSYQAMLGLESNSHDLGWLPHATTIKNEGSSGVVAVVPGGLNEETADMNIAGFGNGPPVFFVAGRVLRGDQTEVSHELARRRKASDVVDLTENGESCEGFHPTEATEGFNGNSVRWRLGDAFKFGIKRSMLSFEILEMIELNAQSLLERPSESTALRGEPETMFVGPCGLARGEDHAMIAQDAGDPVHGSRNVGVIGGP